jgi:hypothetical protein
MAILPTRNELTTLAGGDLFHVVDVSDTTDNPTGSSKKITAANIKSFNDPVAATESVQGIAEIATQPEVDTGVDDERILTALKLKNSKWNSLVFLSSQTVGASTSVDITNIDGTYKKYILDIFDMAVQNDDVDVRLRVSEDNGSTFKSGASDYNWLVTGFSADGKNPGDNNNASSYINIGGKIGGGRGMGNAAGESYSGRVTIHNPASTSLYKNIETKATFTNTNGFVMMIDNAGSYTGTLNAINAIQIFISSGNITSGTFKLYGVK